MPAPVAGLAGWLITRAHEMGAPISNHLGGSSGNSPRNSRCEKEADMTPQTCEGILKISPRPREAGAAPLSE